LKLPDDFPIPERQKIEKLLVLSRTKDEAENLLREFWTNNYQLGMPKEKYDDIASYCSGNPTGYVYIFSPKGVDVQ